MEQVKQHCKQVRPWEQAVKDYSKNCLSKTASQTVSILIYSVVRTNKMYCSNAKRRSIAVEIGKCFHDEADSMSKAMIKMVKAFHGIRLVEQKNLRLPLGCCNFYKMKAEILAIVEQSCPNLLDESERLVDSFSRDALNVACGDYTEDSDKCSKIIHKTPKWTKALEFSSFVIPMAQFMEDLD